MKSIWGKSAEKQYSDKSIELFNSIIEKVRENFNLEFSSALLDCHKSQLYRGARFNTNSQILWVLRSNVEEADFSSLPEHYIMRVLLGACDADYYYKFEKNWD